MAASLRCPICKKEVPFNDPNMPFCSERCRVIDLGNWATGKYVISTSVDPDDWEAIAATDESGESTE